MSYKAKLYEANLRAQAQKEKMHKAICEFVGDDELAMKAWQLMPFSGDKALLYVNGSTYFVLIEESPDRKEVEMKLFLLEDPHVVMFPFSRATLTLCK